MTIFEILFQNSNFIRCLKPNRQNLAKNFNVDYVEEQVRKTGTMTLIQNANIVVKRKQKITPVAN